MYKTLPPLRRLIQLTFAVINYDGQVKRMRLILIYFITTGYNESMKFYVLLTSQQVGLIPEHRCQVPSNKNSQFSFPDCKVQSSLSVRSDLPAVILLARL